MDWQATAALIAAVVGVLTIIGYIVKAERSTVKRHDDTKAQAEGRINQLDAKISQRHSEIYERMRQLEKDFQEYQLHVATRYMDKEEIKENLSKVLGSIRELEKEIREWLVKGANTDAS